MLHPTLTEDGLWGVVPVGEDRWRFRLWAPNAATMSLHLDDRRLPMDKRAGGWFEATAAAPAGESYGFERDGDGKVHPDPAARAQAGGVFARSLLVETPRHGDEAGWVGRPFEEAVIVEIHVGTFTAEGTLAAAARELPRLAALGVTSVELMPVNQFPGARGWGYDGVLIHAVHPAYGSPQDLADFVDAAHRLGVMVLLDVVYNHFGPEGNALSSLCPAFFDASRHTPWGAAIAFERPQVRAFFLQNAAMWVAEYGVDGLRLDAVHQIGPPGSTDFIEELADRVAALDLGRPVHLVAEDERNLARYTGPGGKLAAQWNDDWHHAVHCLLTGEAQSYYRPFSADPLADLVTALAEGQVDQGQPRPFGHPPRGEPSGHLPPTAFVNSCQTHDQVGNRALGERLITLADPEAVRVFHAVLLLSPFVPMLFMGEEEGARAPFLFFTDFHGELAEAVRRGRRSEFPEFADHPGDIPDPNDPATFAASRPYAAPAEDAESWRLLTRALIEKRMRHVVPLLKSGWLRSTAERTGPASLAASWEFEAGTLDLRLTLDGPLPAPPAGAEEIARIGQDDGVAVWIGRRGRT